MGHKMAPGTSDIWTGRCILFLGACLAIAGIGVLGWQCLLWLHDGTWTPLELRYVLELIEVQEPSFQWQGVQKISNWIFGQGLSGVLIVLGAGAYVCAIFILAEGFAAHEAAQAASKRLALRNEHPFELDLNELERMLGRTPPDADWAH